MQKLKRDILLSPYTTYKIGGRADYLVVVKNIKALRRALGWAAEKKLPIFILAGGSNVLFSDEGFRGLVIKIANSGLKFNKNRVRAAAGKMMSVLVEECIEQDYAGLEWAGGLPGTLGGAIRGNAGCFGGEMKDVVESVAAISLFGESRVYQNRDCEFSYRHSRFKNSAEIIWEATLKIKPGESGKLQKEVEEHLRYRLARHPLEFPNCGSVFKNVPIERVPRETQSKFKDKIKSDPLRVLPAAVLITAAGLTGKRKGGAMISEKHSNFIVNRENASAEDVVALIDLTKRRVKDEFGVELEEEIEIVMSYEL